MDETELKALRARVAKAGLKQSEIAGHLSLTQVQVSKSLGGTRRITAREMDLLRAMLNEAEGGVAPVLPALPIIGQVAAGNWREAIQSTREFMPALDASVPRNAFYLDIDGDSMDLIVPNGGRILVDPDDRVLYSDRYFVIMNEDGETTFKQFKSDPARFVPCSSNDTHREIPIGGERFEIVGRVIWSAARL